tara:strand:+ start:1112 stop:1315 length:204 start_codon:yes stop_codon:yes gene_type:complete
MSKGDKPRPLSVSYEEYSNNYETIFGKKDELSEDIAMSEEEEIEAEKRMNIIGRNGNDGIHYDVVDE